VSLRQNALLLIVLTGLLGILGNWSASADLTRWWALPAALLLLGLAYEGAVLRRYTVDLELKGPEYWPLGRAQSMQFVFRHSGRPLSIEAVLSAPGEFAAESRMETLKPGSGIVTVATLTASPRCLGRYAWPSVSMRISGPLRLAWWSRSVATACSVTVVPDMASPLEETPGDHGPGTHRGQTGGAGAEVLQLRDYRRGDPLRAVDWKATARRGRLVSRDFSEDQHLDVIVAIDAGRASALGAGNVDRLSLYVNVAARFAQRAARLDDAVGLVVFAAQPLGMLVPARGDAAVVRIRELLTTCRVHPSESNPVLAAAQLRAMAQRRSLMVILTDLEDASAGEQLVKAVRLLTPKHFPFIAGFQSARIAALSHAAVREPLGAYQALAAIEYANTVEGNVRALRALGAAALIARPEDLDRAVFDAYREFRARRRI
jgi:uncharacterized protein (DUF58 family)